MSHCFLRRCICLLGRVTGGLAPESCLGRVRVGEARAQTKVARFQHFELTACPTARTAAATSMRTSWTPS